MSDHHILSRSTPVSCAVITVSDTRTPDTDTSGAMMQEMLRTIGCTVQYYTILPDEPTQIRAQILTWLDIVDVILLNGGTGISKRDTTFEVVTGLLDKTLTGFGELFRMLSYQEIGAAAMLSRATAGVCQNTVIISTPGSTNAVQLAMQKLVLPEIQHLVWELLRQ